MSVLLDLTLCISFLNLELGKKDFKFQRKFGIIPTMSSSGTKRQKPEDPGPEGIWETKKKIAKLEETNIVIGNPGFPGINQDILFCLDHKSRF